MPPAAIMRMACSSVPTTAPRFSRAAFSEPGTLRMSVFPLVPATARESMARGVLLSPSTHMATGMARISRSSTASVASGCGKSVTLKCIAGIMTPDKGRIVLDGETLFDSEAHIDLTPQQRRVGYLFQQYALFPNMTVAQNIQCGIRTGSRAEKQRQAAEQLRNCQSVCVMENGRSGPVTDMDTLVRHPATQGAARLAGCRNFLPARRCGPCCRRE